ncbi:MAG TPA: ABC transporter permease [Rugosimonospora sp.]|nr:ABC transporter permease [Rugosimonospora sp.]
MKLIRDCWLVFQQQMVLLLRNPIWVFIGVFQPLMYLVLFAPLLGPALRASSSAQTYRTFVPGLLVLLAILSGMFKGFSLIAELRAGVIERARVTPLSRFAMLLGRSLRDVVVMITQAVLITVPATALGLRVHLADLLLAYLLLGVLALTTTSLSYGIALRLRSEDALSPVMNTIAQPLLLLSGILLPLTLAPGWLQRLARWNPFFWAVRGSRALFAGNVADPAVWKGLIIVLALAALSIGYGAREFARSVR